MSEDILKREHAVGKVEEGDMADGPCDVEALLASIEIALAHARAYAWADAFAGRYKIQEWVEGQHRRDGLLEGAAQDMSRAVGLLGLIEDAERALRNLAEEVGSGGR